MKSASKKDARTLVAQTLDYLASAEGRQALRSAADDSKKAAEPFRRTRKVDLQRLNRRFTV